MCGYRAPRRYSFLYHSQWTPVEAKGTPVIELTFLDVQMLPWKTDSDALRDPRWHGQVAAFTWDGADRFDLSTRTLDLSFAAARMEVRLLAAVPNDPPAAATERGTRKG